MIKRNQSTRRQMPTNSFSVFDHFLWLVLKGLRSIRFLRKMQLRHLDVLGDSVQLFEVSFLLTLQLSKHLPSTVEKIFKISDNI